MQLLNHNTSFKIGESVVLKRIFRDKRNNAIPLYNYTVHSHLCTHMPAYAVVNTFGVVIADQADEPGVVYLSLTSEQTKLLTEGVYIADVLYIDGAGEVSISETFNVKVVRGATVLPDES